MNNLESKNLKSRTRLARIDGNVLVELSIVLPLCLFFLVGILEIGRLLAQYSWVQQTGYNAAFLGSGMTQSAAGVSPTAIVNTLFAKLNQQKNALQAPVVTSSYNDYGPNSTISVSINSNMNLLSNIYPLRVGVTTVAPSTVGQFNPGTLDDFGNGEPGVLFDCTGNPCVSGGSCGTSCP